MLQSKQEVLLLVKLTINYILKCINRFIVFAIWGKKKKLNSVSYEF